MVSDQTRLAFQPFASRFFQNNGDGSLVTTPRYRFMYYVRFKVDNSAIYPDLKDYDPYLESNLNLNGWQDKRSVSFLVKKVDRPKITLNTTETNQYNHRKQNYTRLTYGDLNMTLYDTSDNRALTMWINYFRYYFGDSTTQRGGASSQDLKTSLAPMSMLTPNSFDEVYNGYGLRGLSKRNFFESIEIYAIFGKKAQLTRLIQPRITNVDFGSFESSESGPAEVNFSFKYESIEYADLIDLSKKMLLDEMGFDIPAHEPPDPGVRIDDDISRYPQPANFDGRVIPVSPDSKIVTPPANTRIYSTSPLAESTYVPFIGAVGGAINMSPVISPFGILVFGL